MRLNVLDWKTEARILVIGLGEIGSNNAQYMTSKRLRVYGFDIDEKAIENALKNRIIREEANTFENYDYYVICVSTRNAGNISEPSFDGLYETAKRIRNEGKLGSLVSIESTITKGVSNNVKEMLGHRLHVVHFPHRFYGQEKEKYGVRQTRVLGGCEPCCLKKAIHFYRDMLEIPLHIVKSAEIAELSKIVENSYRFLQIAFAEELKMFCDSKAINFKELRKAVNTKWNIEVLEAREGIRGHCLPKETRMYTQLFDSSPKPRLIDAARRTDNSYKKYLARARSRSVS